MLTARRWMAAWLGWSRVSRGFSQGFGAVLPWPYEGGLPQLKKTGQVSDLDNSNTSHWNQWADSKAAASLRVAK
jgi:hypothetical protein